MDGLPVITYAGDHSSFASAQQLIVQHLPREQYEWRRSYGRVSRLVRVTARFVPFNAAQLTAAVMSSAASLSALPFLHIFWLDCDVDVYRARVRDELALWQSQLRALNILDWLVVVVVHDDNKVKSKILRTSVFDKVKGEFAGRHPDRCVQLTAATEPLRYDAASEPWPALLLKLKELVLAAYSRQLVRFEERMRAERECRVSPAWSFNQYFVLQEELAAFYDTLGLYEDALLQYDELDALLTQLVVSYTSSPGAGLPPAWLQCYARPAEHWNGALPLDRAVAARRRSAICEDRACLLDVRSYLLCQQCGLLLRLGQPWEAARRALAATTSSAHELRALDVSGAPAGSAACWSLLTCAGALELCEQFKPSSTATLSDEYHAATAGLWRTVQSCLYGLGNLCGLLQSRAPSSEQLHLVVQLLGGLLDAPDPEPPPTSLLSRTGRDSPAVAAGGGSPRFVPARQRLLSALSSQRSYEEYYLEVTELTMGTFKHIGHPRTARVLGNQLAAFYLQRRETQKAESLLLASLATYDRERWALLAARSQLALAQCQTQAVAAAAASAVTAGSSAAVAAAAATAEVRSLAGTHLAVAASHSLEAGLRREHFECFLELVGSGSAASGSGQVGRASPARLSARSSLRVLSVSCCPGRGSSSRLLTGCDGALQLVVLSALPGPLVARAVTLRMRQCSSGSGDTDAPVPTFSAPLASSGPRLYAELKIGEAGEPTYGVGCSNTRTLLARRDSKPAAAAMAATGRRELLGARPSLDSSGMSVPGAAAADPSAHAAAQPGDGHSAGSGSSSSLATVVTFGADVTPEDGRGGGASSSSSSASTAADDWVLRAPGPVELAAGTTVLAVSSTVPHAGTFRPEELLLELSASTIISLHDESMVRCCTVVAWPACNPSISIEPVQGNGALLFGIDNRCHVTFDLGDRAASVDQATLAAGSCELVCSGGGGAAAATVCGTASWAIGGGSAALVMLPSEAAGEQRASPVLESQVALRVCDPPDFAHSVHGPQQYSVAATWRSAGEAPGSSSSVCAEGTVSFQHPFTVSHSIYPSSASKFVLVTLSALGGCGSATVAAVAVPSFDIFAVDLVSIGGTPVVLQPVRCQRSDMGIKDGTSATLSPTGRVHYLWSLRPAERTSMLMDGCTRKPLDDCQPCTATLRFTFGYRASDSDDSHHQPSSCSSPQSSSTSAAASSTSQGSYTFDADCCLALFEVSKALIPACDYYLMTKECKMAVTIRSLSSCVCSTCMHSHPSSCCSSALEDGVPLNALPETAVSYEIGSSEEWAISGDKRGKVTLRGDAATTLVVLLVPLTSGCLRLPHVTLLSLEDGAAECPAPVNAAAVPCNDDQGVQECDAPEDATADPLPKAAGRTPADSVRPPADSVRPRPSGKTAAARRLSESQVYDRSSAYVVRVLGANDYT